MFSKCLVCLLLLPWVGSLDHQLDLYSIFISRLELSLPAAIPSPVGQECSASATSLLMVPSLLILSSPPFLFFLTVWLLRFYFLLLPSIRPVILIFTAFASLLCFIQAYLRASIFIGFNFFLHSHLWPCLLSFSRTALDAKGCHRSFERISWLKKIQESPFHLNHSGSSFFEFSLRTIRSSHLKLHSQVHPWKVWFHM